MRRSVRWRRAPSISSCRTRKPGEPRHPAHLPAVGHRAARASAARSRPCRCRRPAPAPRESSPATRLRGRFDDRDHLQPDQVVRLVEVARSGALDRAHAQLAEVDARARTPAGGRPSGPPRKRSCRRARRASGNRRCVAKAGGWYRGCEAIGKPRDGLAPSARQAPARIRACAPYRISDIWLFPTNRRPSARAFLGLLFAPCPSLRALGAAPARCARRMPIAPRRRDGRSATGDSTDELRATPLPACDSCRPFARWPLAAGPPAPRKEQGSRRRNARGRRVAAGYRAGSRGRRDRLPGLSTRTTFNRVDPAVRACDSHPRASSSTWPSAFAQDCRAGASSR